MEAPEINKEWGWWMSPSDLLSLWPLALVGAILWAVSVPSCGMGSGARAKVSRVLADLREMRTAIESYAVDNSAYPRMAWSGAYGDAVVVDGSLLTPARRLPLDCAVVGEPPKDANGAMLPSGTAGSVTTPISYITQTFTDPFSGEDPWKTPTRGHYFYFNAAEYRRLRAAGHVASTGTRFPYAPRPAALAAFEAAFGQWVLWSVGPQGWDGFAKNGSRFFDQYDPTNGYGSAGAIFVSQRETKPAWVDAAALEP